MTIYGADSYRYEEALNWAQLPQGMDLGEVVDIAVDQNDQVYLFSRAVHPVMVFTSAGEFITSWGDGMFTRPHGISIDEDGMVYCVDDAGHWIGCFSPDGELLSSIHTRDVGAAPQSGKPFNQPTKVAFDPSSTDLYVSDGYGNARIHTFSRAGEHLFSWGDYGTTPGRFNLPHSIATDRTGRLYVADRENHRLQLFDKAGTFLEQWNNLHRPCGLCIANDLVYIGQLFSQLSVNADYPNIGACITIHDLDGTCLARLGDTRYGDGAGQFIAPHGLAVDSHGDLYVGEVSWTAYGKALSPPRRVKTFRKLVRI